MTVVTHMRLRDGTEPEWDRVMRQRLDNANGRPGFIRSQLLIPLDALDQRVIIGTWATRAHWEAWHNDEAFLAARELLENLQAAPAETRWYEVVEEQPPPGVGRLVDGAVAGARSLATRVLGSRPFTRS